LSQPSYAYEKQGSPEYNTPVLLFTRTATADFIKIASYFRHGRDYTAY